MSKFFSKKETETLVNPLNEYDSIEVMIYRHGDYRLEKELYGENRRLYFIYKNENGNDYILCSQHNLNAGSAYATDVTTLKQGQYYIEALMSGEFRLGLVSVDTDLYWHDPKRLNWKTRAREAGMKDE